jgi:hypothetical protein
MRWKRRPKRDPLEWFNWFAWYPVRTESDWVWLEWVERQAYQLNSGLVIVSHRPIVRTSS